MSTKFRKSFILLCDEFRPSTKGQGSGAVHFCKEYTIRQMRSPRGGGGGGGTISTTLKGSYYVSNGSQLHEKKSLLADNTPTPISAFPGNETKFVFPETFT